MGAPVEDLSDEAFVALLGADVVAHIDDLVAASPEPHPDEYALLRRIFSRALGDVGAAVEPHIDQAA